MTLNFKWCSSLATVVWGGDYVVFSTRVRLMIISLRFRSAVCALGGLLALSVAACATQGDMVTESGRDITILKRVKFDCGLLPPNRTSVSPDGALLLVVGKCADRGDVLDISVFDFKKGSLLNSWSPRRPGLFLRQAPVLLRSDAGTFIVTLQTDQPGPGGDHDFICLDTVKAPSFTPIEHECAFAGNLGNFMGADISPDGNSFLIMDSFRMVRRVWILEFDKGSRRSPRLTELELGEWEEQVRDDASYVVTDAKFLPDSSITIHMRWRGGLDTPDSTQWQLVHISGRSGSVPNGSIISRGDEISCAVWETSGGLIGTPWSYSNFSELCDLLLNRADGGAVISTRVLSRPPPRIRGHGIIAATKSDCCFLVYSNQRALLELFDSESVSPGELIDCGALPRGRCGDVFALNSPGEFISVHGDIAFRFKVAWD